MAALQRRASPPFAHCRYKIELQLQMDEQNRRKEQVSRHGLAESRSVVAGGGWIGLALRTPLKRCWQSAAESLLWLAAETRQG